MRELETMVVRSQARSSRVALSMMVILGFLLVSWAALRPWVAARALNGEPADSATRRALTLDPGNDRIYAALANVYHYSPLLRDYPAAVTAYRSALDKNPLDSTSWLNLGRLYEKLGQTAEADQAFRLATHLGPSDAALLWEVTGAYLDKGQVPEALTTLSLFLAVSPPDNAAKGYELARRLVPPDEVLGKMIASDIDHYTHYANYLLDRNLGDQALAAWNRLQDMTARTGEQVAQPLQLRVIDLLMATGNVDQAYHLWTNLMTQMQPDAAPTTSNLVSNGNFERKETVGRGFDWRIGGAPGVAWTFDPDTSYTGRRSLKLSFTKSRADFSNISQIIPVQPHSLYALQAYIRTDGLAGSPGITVEVIDSAGGVLAGTDAVGGTRGWSPVAVRFRTSGIARTVTLRVHGEPPPPDLSPLSGSAWIDNVSLTKVQ